MTKPTTKGQGAGADLETTEVTTEAVEQTTTSNELATVKKQGAGHEIAEAMAFENTLSGMLSSAEKLGTAEKKISLTTKYIEFKNEGDKFRGVFAGFTEISINKVDEESGEEVPTATPAARFVDVHKNLVVNAGVSLVNEIKKSGVPVGVSLEITYVEKKGRAKIYSIDLIG